MYNGCIKEVQLCDTYVSIHISGVVTESCNSRLIHCLSKIKNIDSKGVFITIGSIEKASTTHACYHHYWVINIFNILTGLRLPAVVLSGTCTIYSLLIALCGRILTMTTFTRLFPFLDTVVVDKYKILHDSDAGSANLKKIYKVEIEGLKQFSNLIAKLLQERKVDLSKLKDVCNNPYNTLSVVECLDLKLVDNVFDTARDITTMLDVVFSAEEQIASNRAEDSISSRRPTVSQDSQQN